MNIFLSYLVHLFTISGVLFSFLAITATINNNLPLSFLYLALALIVDGVDGTLARKVDVKKFTPNINGEILDNIIDFLNYVFVPAFIVYWFRLVPDGLVLFSVGLILTVSCYTFANNQLKTDDYYFSGFPAIWNVVVLYFYILDLDRFSNFFLICLFSVLSFVPIKYLHPFRVNFLRKTSLSVSSIWMISTVLLIYPGYVNHELYRPLFFLWLLTNIYFIALTLMRTFKK